MKWRRCWSWASGFPCWRPSIPPGARAAPTRWRRCGMSSGMFGAFERAVACRYLRARKGERFVSFIAVFSLAGIALGVATLIIVLSVMNGFQRELLTRILGLNGHI